MAALDDSTDSVLERFLGSLTEAELERIATARRWSAGRIWETEGSGRCLLGHAFDLTRPGQSSRILAGLSLDAMFTAHRAVGAYLGLARKLGNDKTGALMRAAARRELTRRSAGGAGVAGVDDAQTEGRGGPPSTAPTQDPRPATPYTSLTERYKGGLPLAAQ